MPPSPPPTEPLASSGSSSSHLDLYFGHELCQSPPAGSDSDSDSTDSQATLEDVEEHGHPLQRMFRVVSQGSSATSSAMYDDFDYEGLIDGLLAKAELSREPSNTVIPCNHGAISPFTMLQFIPKPAEEPGTPLMIRCLPRDSREFYLLLELNHPELRQDPWNPVPHVLHAVEREDEAYIFMDQLYPYDKPPFKKVANYIDFIRQILEGLTFLHELQIAHVSFQDLSCFMIDLSCAPNGCSLPNQFDRTMYPVRYYFTDLSKARKIQASPNSTNFTPPNMTPFRHDVQDCGVMIDWLISHVPRIETKFKSLVKAMTVGGFGAEESRKLFEALCKSLDASTLNTDTPVPQQNVKRNSAFCIPTSNTPVLQIQPSVSR